MDRKVATTFPPRECSGIITEATLKSCTGPGPHFEHALAQARKYDVAYVVDQDYLLAGDLILSRQIKTNGKPVASPIPAVQKRHGFSPEGSYWSHVMLYVGNMFVVETQAVPTKLISAEADEPDDVVPAGIQVRPLTAYSTEYDLLVLRFEFDQGDMGVDDPSVLLQRIARYALLRGAVGGTKYDNLGALNCSVNPRERWQGKPDDRAICSEFVTECYAAAGKLLVEEYDMLVNGIRFILPAHFYDSPSFAKYAPRYLKLAPSTN